MSSVLTLSPRRVLYQVPSEQHRSGHKTYCLASSWPRTRHNRAAAALHSRRRTSCSPDWRFHSSGSPCAPSSPEHTNSLDPHPKGRQAAITVSQCLRSAQVTRVRPVGHHRGIAGQGCGVTRDAVQPSSDNKNKGNNQNEGDPAAADGQSGPVYMARIALNQDWMMTENGKVQLTPGMAVTAEIQTGERRLISYLLSPLVRKVSESMRER